MAKLFTRQISRKRICLSRMLLCDNSSLTAQHFTGVRLTRFNVVSFHWAITLYLSPCGLICTELQNAAPLLGFYVHVVSAWAITLSSATFIPAATEPVGCILVVGHERQLKIPIEMAKRTCPLSTI
jgi:hypothetical protein